MPALADRLIRLWSVHLASSAPAIRSRSTISWMTCSAASKTSSQSDHPRRAAQQAQLPQHCGAQGPALAPDCWPSPQPRPPPRLSPAQAAAPRCAAPAWRRPCPQRSGWAGRGSATSSTAGDMARVTINRAHLHRRSGRPRGRAWAPWRPPRHPCCQPGRPMQQRFAVECHVNRRRGARPRGAPAAGC